jgi:hypothetical protein
MALFSDMDWVIIAVVAAFLFLGPQGQPFVRQMGRWYARLLQFKTDLMSEVATSAGLATPPGPTPASLRSALLGPGPFPEPASAVPVEPSHPGIITQAQPVGLWAVGTETLGAGMGAGTWWVTTTNAPGEVVRIR